MATTSKKAKPRSQNAGTKAWFDQPPVPLTEEEKTARNRYELLNQLQIAVQSAATLQTNGLPVPTTLTQAIDLLSAKLYVVVQ